MAEPFTVEMTPEAQSADLLAELERFKDSTQSLLSKKDGTIKFLKQQDMNLREKMIDDSTQSLSLIADLGKQIESLRKEKQNWQREKEEMEKQLNDYRLNEPSLEVLNKLRQEWFEVVLMFKSACKDRDEMVLVILQMFDKYSQAMEVIKQSHKDVYKTVLEKQKIIVKDLSSAALQSSHVFSMALKHVFDAELERLEKGKEQFTPVENKNNLIKQLLKK